MYIGIIEYFFQWPETIFFLVLFYLLLPQYLVDCKFSKCLWQGNETWNFVQIFFYNFCAIMAQLFCSVWDIYIYRYIFTLEYVCIQFIIINEKFSFEIPFKMVKILTILCVLIQNYLMQCLSKLEAEYMCQWWLNRKKCIRCQYQYFKSTINFILKVN